MPLHIIIIQRAPKSNQIDEAPQFISLHYWFQQQQQKNYMHTGVIFGPRN